MSDIEDDDETATCGECESVGVKEDMHYSSFNSGMICQDCARMCERCNDMGTDSDDFYTVDNELWCISCFENHASWCDYCEVSHTGSSYYPADSGMAYCENCVDNLTYCEDCDEYYRDECSDHNDESSRVIHDYSYRPDPIFHSTDKDERLYFGIEIEVEAPRNLSDAAEYAYRLEEKELGYLKHDGSLNHGFEIVTHPMTHDFYKNEAQDLWDTLSRLREHYGVKSWGTGTCGLHIHVSRTGFKNPPHMHRFLNLIYSNEPLYSKLAGRESSRWAKFDDVQQAKAVGVDEHGYRTYKSYRSFRDKIENGRSTDRYSAVNTQNHATLEIRIFQGSVKPDNVKSQIDLAHASVEYTRDMSVQQVKDGALNAPSFIEYIFAHADLYPELCARISRLLPLSVPVTL